MGQMRLQQPDLLPSARVLQSTQAHGDCFISFIKERSRQAQQALGAEPLSDEQKAHFAQLAQQSIQEQRQIEADDVMPFEEFRQYYVSTERLTS